MRLARKLVLELLGSSVDLSTAPGLAELMSEYGARPGRFGGDAGERCATVAQPVKVDNDLYVRDYGKCVLCYKCVEACGVDAQNTFAIAICATSFPSPKIPNLALPMNTSFRPNKLASRLSHTNR